MPPPRPQGWASLARLVRGVVKQLEEDLVPCEEAELGVGQEDAGVEAAELGEVELAEEKRGEERRGVRRLQETIEG